MPATWIAAHAPRMLGLTGRFGDGWYPTQKMTAAEYAEKAPWLVIWPGLAISRQIVERFGGSLTLADAKSGGAEFIIRLRQVPEDRPR